ncbi:hypothetical protein BZA70DRAFT_277855 [Myxozyma melibiosi]|uniref:Cytochrome c oxidase subunit 8, mitochondrial n=1 Tax=Myxozyma melibiosi TaxID=54550 RepID=A0ABR1F662_9ASCO
MYAPTVARTSVRSAVRSMSAREMIFKRGFQSSQVAKSTHHWPEGPYNNLPFKVHNRRIPFFIPYTLFFLVPFVTPFGMAAFALSKM